jgi:DNA-binding XRE family transcriptional regulator
MKTTEKKSFTPQFVTEKESLESLKKNRPDLYKTLKKPSLKACLAANVFMLRKKKGLNQKELADKAKVGFRTLQRLEEAQPTSNPTVDVIEGIAKALNADVFDLFKAVDLTKSLVR